jgi:hypothetical protein
MRAGGAAASCRCAGADDEERSPDALGGQSGIARQLLVEAQGVRKVAHQMTADHEPADEVEAGVLLK